MLGDLRIDAGDTLVLRATNSEGEALAEDIQDREITATLLRRRTVEEWLDIEIAVQGAWDDRQDEPTTAATLEFALRTKVLMPRLSSRNRE